MGVSGAINVPKEPKLIGRGSQNGAGDIPPYSMLFRPCGLLEALFGKINLPEKNISNLEGLEIFLLGKRRRSGVGERLRYPNRLS